MWTVHLTLTDYEENVTKDVQKHLEENEFYDDNPLSSLSYLLIYMGEYDKAEKYWLVLLISFSHIVYLLICFL